MCVCRVAEEGLFLLLPHVPIFRFDPPLQWFVVIVDRLYVVVCGLTTCDCAVLGDFDIFRLCVVRDLLLCT